MRRSHGCACCGRDRRADRLPVLHARLRTPRPCPSSVAASSTSCRKSRPSARSSSRRLAAGGSPPQPGQFVTVRADVPVAGAPFAAIPSPADGDRLRISVKREPRRRHERPSARSARLGTDVSSPGRTAVTLGGERCRPIALVSAGIGVTPVLAMLHALASATSAARSGGCTARATGRRARVPRRGQRAAGSVRAGHSQAHYSRPQLGDVVGRDFDDAGRVNAEALREVGVPLDAEYRAVRTASSPSSTDGLRGAGFDATAIDSESFGGTPVPAVTQTERRRRRRSCGRLRARQRRDDVEKVQQACSNSPRPTPSRPPPDVASAPATAAGRASSKGPSCTTRAA